MDLFYLAKHLYFTPFDYAIYTVLPHSRDRAVNEHQEPDEVTSLLTLLSPFTSMILFSTLDKAYLIDSLKDSHNLFNYLNIFNYFN